MNTFTVLELILSHPMNKHRKLRALWDFAVWQCVSRLWHGKLIFPFVGNTRLVVGRSMLGATGNVYNGIHDFEDMLFLLHMLRDTDVFHDVGANVGAYTVLASGVIGSRTVAFEPVPATFEELQDNIRLNNLTQRVELRHEGVGKERGVLHFTAGDGPANHVATAAEQQQSSDGHATIAVPVAPLDDLPEELSPTLMKIDVEGFETEVIAGGTRCFSNPKLLAILIELNGAGARYGFSDRAIHEQLLRLGFRAFTYEPYERKLRPLDSLPPRDGNTLYVRDLEQVTARLKKAPPISIRGQSI